MDKKKYNLFLDDDPNRIPHKLTWIELPLVEWVIVRNYKDFVETILRDGIPQVVSIDHDLGNSSYQEFFRSINDDKIINYGNILEKTGYDCAKFLIEYCQDNNINFPIYFVHSLNYIGRENIISLIESYKKSKL